MFVVEKTTPPAHIMPHTLKRGIQLPDFIRINGTSIILTARDFDELRDKDGVITIDIEQKQKLV